MKAITLRNLPPEVERKIQKQAREKGISLNRAVIGLLEQHLRLGQAVQPIRHHDLDHLFGAWTAEQCDQFNKVLAEQRRVDPELWR